jgi:hypothetical protein
MTEKDSQMPKLLVVKRRSKQVKKKVPAPQPKSAAIARLLLLPLEKEERKSQPMAPKVNEMKSAGKLLLLLLGWLAPPKVGGKAKATAPAKKSRQLEKGTGTGTTTRRLGDASKCARRHRRRCCHGQLAVKRRRRTTGIGGGGRGLTGKWT